MIATTQKVHEQIAELLNDLRQMKEVKIQLETRFLLIGPSVLSELGISDKDVSAIREDEVEFIAEKVLANPHSRSFPTKKVDVPNAQPTRFAMPSRFEHQYHESTFSFDVGSKEETIAATILGNDESKISIKLESDSAILCRLQPKFKGIVHPTKDSARADYYKRNAYLLITPRLDE